MITRVPYAKSERRHREAVIEIMQKRWGHPEPQVRANEQAWIETGKGYDGTMLNALARAMAGFEKLGRAQPKKIR